MRCAIDLEISDEDISSLASTGDEKIMFHLKQLDASCYIRQTDGQQFIEGMLRDTKIQH